MQPGAAHWAHDIRNALATVSLHLETLQRLSGPRGHAAVEAAHALIGKATGMCNNVVASATRTERRAARRAFDVAMAIHQVAELLAPSAREGFSIRAIAHGSFFVLADPQDAFRILYNLAHNAMVAAQRHAQMTQLTFNVERDVGKVVVRIADDGPGLPAKVRSQLFRPQAKPSASGSSGLGLAIARELAERNGGMLALVPCARGTVFTLDFPAITAMESTEGPLTRLLGKRVASNTTKRV
jgi:signal transduction histidine kinase